MSYCRALNTVVRLSTIQMSTTHFRNLTFAFFALLALPAANAAIDDEPVADTPVRKLSLRSCEVAAILPSGSWANSTRALVALFSGHDLGNLATLPERFQPLLLPVAIIKEVELPRTERPPGKIRPETDTYEWLLPKDKEIVKNFLKVIVQESIFNSSPTLMAIRTSEEEMNSAESQSEIQTSLENVDKAFLISWRLRKGVEVLNLGMVGGFKVSVSVTVTERPDGKLSLVLTHPMARNRPSLGNDISNVTHRAAVAKAREFTIEANNPYDEKEKLEFFDHFIASMIVSIGGAEPSKETIRLVHENHVHWLQAAAVTGFFFSKVRSRDNPLSLKIASVLDHGVPYGFDISNMDGLKRFVGAVSGNSSQKNQILSKINELMSQPESISDNEEIAQTSFNLVTSNKLNVTIRMNWNFHYALSADGEVQILKTSLSSDSLDRRSVEVKVLVEAADGSATQKTLDGAAYGLAQVKY